MQTLFSEPKSSRSHTSERKSGRQILATSKYVVHEAAHDAAERYPPPKCHPDTRMDIVNFMLEWLDIPLEGNQPQMFWVNGPAGVGKTAIAQTLCELLETLGRLGAGFFFSRSVAGRSNPQTLFPTLAHQLSIAYPDTFGSEIDMLLKESSPEINPRNINGDTMLRKHMELQLEKLVVNPLKRIRSVPIPIILIIDGIDEIGTEKDQSAIIQILRSSLLHHRLPLKIVLLSRPEPWIREAFLPNPQLCDVHAHFLGHTIQTDHEIRIVLEAGFEKIQTRHERMRNYVERWPSSRVIDELVQRASGQFIYATTILKYLEDPNETPTDRLMFIMKSTTDTRSETSLNNSPFLGLDILYTQILATSSDIGRTLDVLGIIIVINDSSRSLARITQEADGLDGDMRPIYLMDWVELMLDLRAGEGTLALRTIHSLVGITERSFKFYHKSFHDFLLDPSRSRHYFVDINRVHSRLLVCAFKRLKYLERSEDGLHLNKREILLLKFVRLQWQQIWLRSSASDQDALVNEIKVVDKAAFRLHYTRKMAGEQLSLLFNKTEERSYWFLILRYTRTGNIADLILSEKRHSTSPSPAWAKLLAAEAVFRHLTRRI